MPDLSAATDVIVAPPICQIDNFVIEDFVLPSHIQTARETWRKFCAHAEKWFYRPDLEAVEILLSCVIAHRSNQPEPCWCFFVGPSGSGKTALLIKSASAVPKTFVEGALTQHSLLSFYSAVPQGLLVDAIAKGGDGIVMFKDFTTILTMNDQSRAEIVGQLREVYDGEFKRRTGVGEYHWKGKVTVLAACTPALEKAWSVQRDMGERFLTVRWPRSGGEALAVKAGEQQGHEEEIAKTTAALGREVVCSRVAAPGVRLSLPSLNVAQLKQLAALAELVATLRPQVSRAKGGEIVEVPGCEEPGRVHKSLSLIVRAHASVWNGEVCDDDLRLAKRVARDSVPLRRLVVLEHMVAGETISVADLAKRNKVPQGTVRYNLEELEALGAVERVASPSFGGDDCEWRLREDFLGLNRSAGYGSILK